MPPEVKIIKNELLSDNWYTLRKIIFDLRRADGQWELIFVVGSFYKTST